MIICTSTIKEEKLMCAEKVLNCAVKTDGTIMELKELRTKCLKGENK
jgi:hypothetical protein